MNLNEIWYWGVYNERYWVNLVFIHDGPPNINISLHEVKITLFYISQKSFTVQNTGVCHKIWI